MVGRVLLLVAAVLVAGLGALLVYLYASQAEQRALAQFDSVTAVVVQGEVPAGTPVDSAVDQGLLAAEELPARNVPAQAVGSLADVGGLVVLTDLVPGETLVRSRVGDPAEQERIRIPDGQLALSFALEDPNRVAGFVDPGSEVAVLLTYQGPVEGAPPSVGEDGEVLPPATPVAGSTTGRTTRVLLERVLVLAVGADTRSEPAPDDAGAAVPQTLLTLALSKEQAETMVLAQDVGSLYLALLDPGSDVPPGDGVQVPDLFEVAP